MEALVIAGAVSGIVEGRIGAYELSESLGPVRTRVHIRVMLARQASERPADLIRGRLVADA
jgi:hypothetical protein